MKDQHRHRHQAAQQREGREQAEEAAVVERAQVRVDGRDAASLPATTLRDTFAWLPQDARLIAGTVRDNLALAGDGDAAAMWRAQCGATVAFDDIPLMATLAA